MDYKNSEKILLILDIDETLIHATRKELNHKADFKVFDYYIYQILLIQHTATPITLADRV